LDAAVGAGAAEAALVRSAPVLPLREGWPALQRALEKGTVASEQRWSAFRGTGHRSWC
jgi:hypothetical protein